MGSFTARLSKRKQVSDGYIGKASLLKGKYPMTALFDKYKVDKVISSWDPLLLVEETGFQASQSSFSSLEKVTRVSQVNTRWDRYLSIKG